MLTDFSACCINYEDSRIKSPAVIVNFKILLSVLSLSLSLLPHYFEALLLYIYIFRLIMSSCYIDSFVIMK